MADDEAKAVVDAMLNVLHRRKGFDWWWDDIGARNRANIKRSMRGAARRVIKASAAEPLIEILDGEGAPGASDW